MSKMDANDSEEDEDWSVVSSIDKWLEGKKFSKVVVTALDDLGVNDFSDLQILMEDEKMCADFALKVKPVEMKRLQLQVQKLGTPGKGPMEDVGAGAGTGVVQQEVKALEAKLAAALRAQGDNSSAAAAAALRMAEMRMAEMSDKIARLEQQSENRKTELQQQLKLRATRHREKSITVLIENLDKNATLDLLFMLDCTGSMRCYIDSARKQITELVAELGNLYPDITLRLGFVGYRDHCNGRRRIVQLPFTQSVAHFKRFVAAQTAQGGCGNFADVLGGLETAAAQDWTSTTRILYHLGDQPCHGAEFNADPDDCGTPTGLDALTQLKALSAQDVLYFFGQITSCTDRMIGRFNELMEGEFVVQTPLKADNLMKVVISSVTISLSASLSSSSRTDGATKVKDFEIDTAVPDWGGVQAELAVLFKVRPPTSVAALVEEADDKTAVEDFPHPDAVQLLVAPRPFAKGAVRLAYHAQELPTATAVAGAATTALGYVGSVVLGLGFAQASSLSPSAGAGLHSGIMGQSRVMKESLSAARAHQKLERFSSYLSPQRAAAFLAEEFENLKPQGCASIRFVNTGLLQFMARPDKPYMIMEEEIDGVWEKYNGNSGYCSPQPTPLGTDHSAVQCFSHWTHHITGGMMMVVDCQGSWTGAGGAGDAGGAGPTPGCFLLTDPAMHCTEMTRFGSTNLGLRGFGRFFRTHRCNQHCAALRLPESPLQQTQAHQASPPQSP